MYQYNNNKNILNFEWSVVNYWVGGFDFYFSLDHFFFRALSIKMPSIEAFMIKLLSVESLLIKNVVGNM